MEYRSIADLSETIAHNPRKVPRDVDLVVGVPRSGLLAANLFALYNNLPFTDVAGLIEGRVLASGHRLEAHQLEVASRDRMRVLVLDDSVFSGWQMTRVRRMIEEAGLPHEIIYGAVYAAPDAVDLVDVYFEVVPPKRMFGWNILNHGRLINCCVDIDGVLCVDPTAEENDDGEMYEEFISNAQPLIIPKVKVGWLVTTRLERYRELTEQWLREHGIEYRELRMLDLPSKAERVRLRPHAKFKASVYERTGADLFVESALWQAREISARTGRQVFCIENWQMISERPRFGLRSKRWMRGKGRALRTRCCEFAKSVRRPRAEDAARTE